MCGAQSQQKGQSTKVEIEAANAFKQPTSINRPCSQTQAACPACTANTGAAPASASNTGGRISVQNNNCCRDSVEMHSYRDVCSGSIKWGFRGEKLSALWTVCNNNILGTHPNYQADVLSATLSVNGYWKKGPTPQREKKGCCVGGIFPARKKDGKVIYAWERRQTSIMHEGSPIAVEVLEILQQLVDEQQTTQDAIKWEEEATCEAIRNLCTTIKRLIDGI